MHVSSDFTVKQVANSETHVWYEDDNTNYDIAIAR
jgi:hypothetical protein